MFGFFPSPIFISSALASAILWMWFHHVPEAQDTALLETKPAIETQLESVFDIPKGSQESLETLSEMTARPLFSETRRPTIFSLELELEEPPEETVFEEFVEPEPEDYVEEEAPVEPPRFGVQGFLNEDDGPRALIRDLDNDTQIWVSQGDSVGDWSVTMITPNEVHLSQGTAEFIVKLYD